MFPQPEGASKRISPAWGIVFEPAQIRSFDPNAEETVFFPRLVGGRFSVAPA
jgi:hypothetical protein